MRTVGVLLPKTSLSTILSVAPTPIPPPSPNPPVTWTIVFVWTDRNEKVAQIQVLFSGALNAVQAERLGIYRLATAGEDGSFDGHYSRVIKLGSAQYGANENSVTLTPRRPFSLTKVFQLRIAGEPHGGLHDSNGRLIDGDGNGKPGGNVEVVLWHPGVTFSEAAYESEVKRVATFQSEPISHAIELS
jgi:hypothetical protein